MLYPRCALDCVLSGSGGEDVQDQFAAPILSISFIACPTFLRKSDRSIECSPGIQELLEYIMCDSLEIYRICMATHLSLR